MKLGKVDDINDEDIVWVPVQQQLMDCILVVLGPWVLASGQGLIVPPVELPQHPKGQQLGLLQPGGTGGAVDAVVFAPGILLHDQVQIHLDIWREGEGKVKIGKFDSLKHYPNIGNSPM